MLIVIVAGVVITCATWWALAWAAPAALFAQAGFVAHEACHEQILRNSCGNYVVGLTGPSPNLASHGGDAADRA